MFNEISVQINEIDRNEYTSHIRSVEHQIADVKQRLTYLEQQSIEHETQFKNFDENLRKFEVHFQTFQQTISTHSNELSQLDVSRPMLMFAVLSLSL